MVKEINNPIIETLVNNLRNINTDALYFKHIIRQLGHFLLYEALKDLKTVKKDIQTWQGNKEFDFIDEDNLIFITVLRAGLPMIEALSEVLPNVTSGFLAMKRDEKTHKSVLYYDRVPKCDGKVAILVDPMLATGGSLCDAFEVLRKKNVKKIISLNIIGSPEGLKVIKEKYPEVDIYIAKIDEKLNSDKFIIPGLGDAGDRSYNTPEV